MVNQAAKPLFFLNYIIATPRTHLPLFSLFQYPILHSSTERPRYQVLATQLPDFIVIVTMAPSYCEACLQTHEVGFDKAREDETASKTSSGPTLSERLLSMLRAARQANKEYQLREPTKYLLARLQAERASRKEAQDDAAKVGPSEEVNIIAQHANEVAIAGAIYQ